MHTGSNLLSNSSCLLCVTLFSTPKNILKPNQNPQISIWYPVKRRPQTNQDFGKAHFQPYCCCCYCLDCFCMFICFCKHTQIFTFILYNDHDNPYRESLRFFTYLIPFKFRLPLIFVPLIFAPLPWKTIEHNTLQVRHTTLKIISYDLAGKRLTFIAIYKLPWLC